MNRSSTGARESVTERGTGWLRLTRLRYYGLAVLSVAIAMGVALLLQSLHFRDAAVPLLLFAVAITSWYCRTGPAVLAVVLSIIGFYWYFVEPVRTIYIYESEIPYFIIFVAFASLISWFAAVRRRAEATLREQANLLDLTHDTILVMSLDGVIKYWNRGAEERYGWTAEEAVGGVVQDLLKTIYPAPLEEIKDELRRTGRWEAELVHTKKDGTRVTVASRWSLQRDQHGAPIAIMEVSNDITERKRVENALRESEAYLAEAQRLSHTGSWAFDVMSKTYVYASAEDSRIFGFDSQQGLRTRDDLFERVHPEDRNRWKLSFEKAILEKRDCLDEYRIVLPDGTIKHIRTVRHPVLNDAGEVIRLIGTSIDITEHKRTEETLRRTESYLAEAQRLTHTGSWAWAPAGLNVVYWSEEMFRIFGCNPEDGVPPTEKFWQRVHPEDRDSTYELAVKAASENIEYEHEHRIVLPDGTVKYVRAIGHPVLDDDGVVALFIGTTVDITERKRADEVLRRSEAYLAEAQRLSHTGSWADNGSPVYWSEEHYRIFGLDPKKGLPTREQALDRIHPDDRGRVVQAFETGTKEKVDGEAFYRIVLPDGTVKHAHGIGHPVLDADGNVAEMVGTTIDITERKRAEETLRESETRLRTFLDHAADAFFMLDFEKGTIFDLNQPACESLGYTREELIGLTPLSFDVNLDQPTFESISERAAKDGTVLFDQHWHRRKDGSQFPVEVHTSVFWHGGRRFLLKVARDITDRLRAEEQRERLREREAELAHINRVSVMGELTASIAHEVNQPLSGVVSNGSACLRWLAGDTPNVEEARETARRIVRDGKRAAEIIARIRALTKRTSSLREKLDLNEIIRDDLALVGDEAKKKSVIIRTSLAEDLPSVAGDRVHVQQVLFNLIINAIEAMMAVGDRPRELVISTSNTDSGEVEVTVEDSGPGLDPAASARIFDPFYTTKPTGMGMGLSICRSIVQAHGGRLWTTARQGPGTRFHFTLPKQQEEANAEPATV